LFMPDAFMPDTQSYLGVQDISRETGDSGRVVLVRAEDRYFLGWLDEASSPPLLRWKILSASDWGEIRSGYWPSDSGGFIRDFVAAYHPDQKTVLVALLTHSEGPVEECRVFFVFGRLPRGNFSDPCRRP
jgi:hypothetical protein